ncbi:pre-mRNA-processing protein 40A-like isoform X1 [Coffea arabica]|uniref:Pre-mRNA-processing protein 40A-like isoform X1 n=1 Tax=Coffea arabica TaxID=13443 RepID=A0ABM4WV28_COFAR|nr:pre-mRNA-processing protein 40A-like [Coffea arabica]XP_027112667.1 pre-mRNA-processing protein 40A-like [Coffea arabica]
MANNSQYTGMQPHRPPLIGSLGPPQSALPSMPLQYRAVPPPQQTQPYVALAPQPFLGHANVRMPPPPLPPAPQIQFHQPMHQLPLRPPPAGEGLPQAQARPLQDFQQSGPPTPVPGQPQQNTQISNNYMPGFGGPRMPLSSSNTQINVDPASQHQPMSQTTLLNFPAEGQAWLSNGNQGTKPITPVQQTQEPCASAANPEITSKPDLGEKVSLLWIEHTARNGKKYYYNRLTRLSTWEKPLALMTPIERADASTDWREYTSPDGRKYYYNRVAKQSKWRIPDEVKLARERVNLDSLNKTQERKDASSQDSAAVSTSEVNASSSSIEASIFPAQPAVSSPNPVAPIVTEQSLVTPESSIPAAEVSPVAMDDVDMQTSLESHTPFVAVLDKDAVSVALETTVRTPVSSCAVLSAPDTSVAGVSPGNSEEARKDIKDSARSEEKTVEQGPLVYENKLEAKNAFKALLETENVGSDWTWDQAMRVIINDRRYGALKSLGERKQAFNEFASQKKKQEAEERRARQKKAREDFKKMLEESKELTPSIRWSKAISTFEDDERFKAVERAKDREDLFENYKEELEKKERAKAMEEQKHNRVEYLEFLKSCDFIKASSQWRKVQDRLEADERCSRLEKIDRLEIFQEYIRDLEKEEEEQLKLRREEQRKAERKNRDEFRKLMEEHVAAGILTAKTLWRDYCIQVKDSPAYLAVSSNSSGSTAKELFDDVSEELVKKYLDDKAQIRDAVNIREISLTSSSTLDDFKAAIAKDVGSPVSDVNLKLVFDELLERAREKEEKEAKRRKRLADDLYQFLHGSKEISISSRWEDWKQLIEHRFIGEESFLQETFEKFIMEQKEKAKEKERKHREDKARKDKDRRYREKKKEKHRRDKEKVVESRKGKERPKSDGTDSDRTESHSFEERERSGRDRDSKHRKRHSSDNTSLDENEKDRPRNSHRHSDERKKLKRVELHSRTPEIASDSQYKKQRRDHRDSYRSGDHDEYRGGEIDEDGEVR